MQRSSALLAVLIAAAILVGTLAALLAVLAALLFLLAIAALLAASLLVLLLVSHFHSPAATPCHHGVTGTQPVAVPNVAIPAMPVVGAWRERDGPRPVFRNRSAFDRFGR